MLPQLDPFFDRDEALKSDFLKHDITMIYLVSTFGSDKFVIQYFQSY